MDFGFYYDPRAGPDPRRRLARSSRPAAASTTPAEERLLHVPPLRHAEHRAADRELHRRSRAARSRRRTTSRCGAPSPTRATGRGRRCSRRASRARYLGVDVFEGHYTYARDEHRPELGRLDVRGADGAAASSRRRSGRRRAGASTTRSTSQAQIDHGLQEAAVRLLGLLALEQPRRRLPRVRRRPDRARARTATPPTRSGRSSTTASRAAGRRAAADRLRPRRRHAARLVPRARLRARGRRSRTSRSCAATSTRTAPAASTTRSTSSPARSRATTWRSTRG